MNTLHLKKTIESLILSEDNYAAQMDTDVIPWLEDQKQELWLARNDNYSQKIYCAKYTAPYDFENDINGVVIISHGYTENADKYKEVIYYFLKMGYHVYIPDHCGHGRSYRLTDDLSLVHVDRYERYIEDLLLVAHYAKDEAEELPLYLYGHSMGGGIAAAAVATEPDLFQKVILSSPMIQPDTSKLPWKLTGIITRIACLFGLSSHYLPGGHPYDASETFEESSSVSEVRFNYQQGIRSSEKLFQNTCGSYQWVKSAAKLRTFLMHTAWKKIHIPLLLFQAENDHVVSANAQYKFIQKISRRHTAPTWLIKVPGSKHEIYNADSEILVKYWTKIFRFLG